MSYRKLSNEEIEAIEKRGCTAADWSAVEVADPFDPERLRDTHFSGAVRLGAQRGTAKLQGGVERPAGIYSATLHNASIGTDVLIEKVGLLANMDIEEGAVLAQVGSCVTEEESTFGNGTEIEPLNEGGGRVIRIFDGLNAQIAYFLTLYRDRSKTIEKLESMIDGEIAKVKSSRGRIGKGARVVLCDRLESVRIGSSARVVGARLLSNVTIQSCPEDPTRIGDGVMIHDAIVCSGARIEEGALVAKSFIGQASRIGKQYSAEGSVFFANCEGFHGEAVSIFAGPYTVTHHKSTLLIAGLFSFYNAGSGTNQSNHMYKLGPLHQGIVERGSKTGSFSYMLWPCRVGAFSAVMGNHKAHFDSSDLPFSYLTVEEGSSTITPAMNLFTVGTRRDGEKWPKRDRRKDPDKRDLIRFEVLSPYTVGRMLRGMEELTRLYESSKKEQKTVTYKGASIQRLMLRTGSKYYEMAVKVYLGRAVVEAIEQANGNDPLESARAHFGAPGAVEDWIDVAGLLAPKRTINSLLSALEDGEIKDVASLHDRLRSIHAAYADEEAKWISGLLAERLGHPVSELTAEELAGLINDWKTNSVRFNNMIQADASKEFDQGSRIGYGIDGDAETVTADFAAVRGTLETNSFVKSLAEESKSIEARAQRILESMGAAAK